MKYKLVAILLILALFIPAASAWAIQVRVKNFYETTGVGLVCGNPKICTVKTGKTVEGLVLKPEILQDLGFTGIVRRGETIELIYQGGGFWTITDPRTGESTKVKIK